MDEDDFDEMLSSDEDEDEDSEDEERKDLGETTEQETEPDSKKIEAKKEQQQIFAKWCRSRGNFETGILLLMVLAIPFLVIMIAIYVTQYHSPPSQRCEDLCQAMEKKIQFSSEDRFGQPVHGGIPARSDIVVPGEKGVIEKSKTKARNRTKSAGGGRKVKKKMGYYIPVDGLGSYDVFEISDSQTVAPEFFQHHEVGSRSKRSEILVPLGCNITLTSPAIVALLENLHRDDDSQQVYKCMGLMWPPDILLTSNLCLRDFLEGFDLKIRINSTFWSKNGLLWNVKSSDYEHINSHFKSSKDPFLTVLGIRRGLQENNICVEPHLVVHPKVKFATGLFFTWSSDLSLPLKQRTKFSALRSLKVHLKYESDIILGSSENPRECLNDLGGPLMSPNGTHVLGILLYTDCQNGNGTTYYFANLQLSHYTVFSSK